MTARIVFLCLLILAATSPLLATSPPTSDAAVSELEKQVMEWRENRDAGLRKKDGWLSLIGLHWLETGRSTIGSGPDNDVVLATGPERLGHLTVEDGEVSFCPDHPGVHVDGEHVDCAGLSSDLEDDYTRVTFDSVLFYLIDREGQLGLRVKDAEAKTLVDFHGMDHFPIDPDWRVQAHFEPHEEGRMMEIPNVLGSIERSPNPGRVIFEKDGKTHTLEAVRYEGDDELFLIFADRTSGKSTYGAGRFLYVPLPDEQGRLPVDFNRAYNPPCVFTPYATCPLPPPGNRLDLTIEAGEKNYAGSDH